MSRAGLLLVAAAGAAALWAAPQRSLAQQIDYDPRRPQVLQPCDEQLHRGQLEPARRCYQQLADNAGDPLVEAEAQWALGDTQGANDALRVAARREQAAYARARRGRLFIHTHQYADALELLKDAAERYPEDAQIKLAVAQVFAEQFEGQARELLEEALEEDPNLIAGHLLAARIAIEEGRAQDADKALDRALKLIEQRKLPPLEVYTMRAAFELMRNPDPITEASQLKSEWIDRTLKYNPRYGTVFAELAQVEILRRRYREGDVLLKRAVEIQPDLWTAHAELGVNVLRLGQIDEARKHLVIAYEGDPYSATTVNTLRLLDSFEQYDFVTLPDMKLQLKKTETAALQPYVEKLTREAAATFSKRYGFTPQQPITVEMYPDHDDFAVRTAGLPGLGLLGVTFGYLVAMDSPSGRPPGEFHWGSTLWHELAHVFTLSATDHRVPRWLSEGISVFEEWRTGPTPGVSVTPDLIAALRDDKLLPIDQLDTGFIRPTYAEQVQISYMQAGLVCLFIEQKWGFPQLVALLNQFKRHTTTAAAVEAALKVSPKQFDKQFQDFARERYAGMLQGGERWQQAYRAAAEAYAAELWPRVLDPARAAIAIYPEHLGDDSPYLMLARALDRTGARAQAIETLQQYRSAGGWHPDAMRELAQWLTEAKRDSEATDILQALNYVAPFDQAGHAQLAERLLAQNQPAQALSEYRVLMALGPHDKAAASFGMARALQATGDARAARRQVLESLEIAPNYVPAQQLLLKLVEAKTQ